MSHKATSQAAGHLSHLIWQIALTEPIKMSQVDAICFAVKMETVEKVIIKPRLAQQ